ncbi:MAG: hypothetical protein NTY91_02140 [Euryarchaeota archaeon]|nr:hypothetical protein [Euryarchaeota archaeon]
MLDSADVTRQFVETIIEIIGRKTSQEYAVVAIQNLLKKLRLSYPFLREIQIKNSRSSELEGTVSVNDSLNTIPPKDVGQALKELIKKIMISLGKTAGYFFIRETREKIGTEYDTFLLKTMDVDLTLLQSTLIVENKSINVLEIQKSDVIRRFLKVLLEAVEKQTSKSFAIACLQQHIEKLRQSYPFLDSVLVNDIRYTLGPENLIVHQEINTIEPQELGRALTSILQEIDKTLTDLGRNSIASDLRAHLTFEYLAKLNEMSVTITSQGIGNNAVFTQVIKTLIDTIGKSSSEDYAIFVINSFLRKIDTKYEFLKLINVETAVNKGELYHIVIGGNLDTISETDARRSIQLLLESIIRSLGKISDEFVQEFKNSLDKKYLLKIEEIGINFHMIELHEAMSPKIE